MKESSKNGAIEAIIQCLIAIKLVAELAEKNDGFFTTELRKVL